MSGPALLVLAGGMGSRYGGLKQMDGGIGGGFGDSTTSNVRDACIVIDMLDSSSRNLLWRGVSRAELSNNSNANRKHLHEDIAKNVQELSSKLCRG